MSAMGLNFLNCFVFLIWIRTLVDLGLRADLTFLDSLPDYLSLPVLFKSILLVLKSIS